MKVLIVPDKFKGSLTAEEAITAIRAGLTDRDPTVRSHAMIASDGGDGFLQAVLKSDAAVELQSCETSDPLGRPITADYGIRRSDGSAFIEMAKASGMELLQKVELDPYKTSTFGTGRLIADAIDRGMKTIYVGLGGSATNDGGCGIARAVGYRMLDQAGVEIEYTGGGLEKLWAIDQSSVRALDGVRVLAINDVANPLVGSQGASVIYCPQKGADSVIVDQLDRNLAELSEVVKRDLGIDAASLPGAGAAGGTGYGLSVFLGADFLSGVEFVLSLTGIEDVLSAGDIDLIITGEGRIDDQTAYGKLVRGVATVGESFRIPVIAVCGINALKTKTAHDLGVKRIIELHDPSRPVETTIRDAALLLRQAVAGLDLEPIIGEP
ncbi:MAG: glycerate kinase [Planctomycetota bacterium]